MRKTARRSKKREAENAVQRLRCLELRRKRWTYKQISEEVGISMSKVHDLVAEALEELRQQSRHNTELLVAEELDHLDVAARAIHAKVLAGDLGAIEKWVKISENRAKLLGLGNQQSITMRFEQEAAIEQVEHKFAEIVGSASSEAVSPEPQH